MITAVRHTPFHEGEASALQAGGGDPGGEVPLEDQEDREDRNQGQGGHGEQQRPRRLRLLVEEGPQRQRHGEVAGRVDEDHLREEVVPAPDEGEDRGGDQRRLHQRQDDAQVDLDVAAPVDPGGVVQFGRDAPDELHHQKDEEGVYRQEVRHGERQEGV